MSHIQFYVMHCDHLYTTMLAYLLYLGNLQAAGAKPIQGKDVTEVITLAHIQFLFLKGEGSTPSSQNGEV